jgi:hypothetical protein
VSLVLYDLSQKRDPTLINSDGLRFYPLTEISKAIEAAWDTLWLKSKGGSWRTSISGALAGNKERFMRGTMENTEETGMGLFFIHVTTLIFI